MNCLQKKKQAIIMMLAAQIIKTAEGYPVAINDCESGTAVDYTVFGNTVTGKNLLRATDFYSVLNNQHDIKYSEIEEDGRSCVRFIDSVEIKYQDLIFKENTRYTISMDCKTVSRSNANTTGSLLFVFFYTDGTYSNAVSIAKNTDWTHKTATSLANKTISAIGLRSVNYTNWCYVDVDTFQLEEGTSATEYEPYSESYAGDKTKNLIPYPYYESTKTVNGITFTDNGDGTITANGTATKLTVYKILPLNPETFVDYPAGKYIFSGCPSGGSLSTYCINFAASSTFTGYDDIMDANDIGAGKLCSAPNGMKRIFAKIIINPNTVCNNLVFKPQLELGTTATEYEPYGYKIPIVNSSEDESRDNAVINIYLDEPLKQGEGINFGADNLPELQLFEGSNIITADTEVKPEKISVDYYEKG